jgi:hypothetical protein
MPNTNQKITQHLQKAIEGEKDLMHQYYSDALIRDGHTINTPEDTHRAIDSLDFDEYMNMAYSIGYLNGLQQAIDAINNKIYSI